ncbi:MAG: UDP-2,3-diacylglucosamine hydrolase [Candidatus Erwinia impunctatus]|nr:UDP-2,3-diacylglucosamine hydrolase [Culicoides impunctatus]
MSCTLFIADLHLSNEEPAITAGFLAFLRQQAPQADALYILGDLFEVWIGDDDANPLHDEVSSALSALTLTGVPCYFIHGNRDFLLGKAFARRCNMTLLPEEQVLTLYGRRIQIMHGDTLCTDDAAYQQFRHKMHQRWRQQLFLWLPLMLRQGIAKKMRQRSQQANQHKTLEIMDVNPQAVEAQMQKHHVHYLIHGHTHRPAIHSLTLDGEKAERLVLGAWHEQGSVIRVSEDSVSLVSFPF